MCANKVNIKDDQRERIRGGFAEVNEHMLPRAWGELECKPYYLPKNNRKLIKIS